MLCSPVKNDPLVEILEALQADCHTLQELKDFVNRDEFQMKDAYQVAHESFDLHIFMILYYVPLI